MHTVTGPDDPNIPADTESTHIMCGVDKLHAEGLAGAGIKIGIIDTGFDYLHPSREY
jgi:subtilisin family serine protease